MNRDFNNILIATLHLEWMQGQGQKKGSVVMLYDPMLECFTERYLALRSATVLNSPPFAYAG